MTAPSLIATPRLRLLPLDAEAIAALIERDHVAASQRAGCDLTPGFRDSLGEAFLAIQLQLLQRHPDQGDWCVRVIVRTDDCAVVGHCGFHGPPAAIGRVEIGYHIFAAHRRQGYATEAARGLVEWAGAHGHRTVLASISPDNAPSLAVIHRLGFRPASTSDDGDNDAELVFEHRDD